MSHRKKVPPSCATAKTKCPSVSTFAAAGRARPASPNPVYAEDFSELTTWVGKFRMRIFREKIRVLS